MVNSTPRPYFAPVKDPVPIVQAAGRAPRPAWKGGKSRQTGIRSPHLPARSSVAIPTELPGPRFYGLPYPFKLPEATVFPICYSTEQLIFIFIGINPYPTAFPYGNGMVLHFYQQQESSTTKTVHKVINKGLKAYV